MDLWVRSQLKGSLIKVNDLRIMQLDKDGFRMLIEEDAKEGWCIIVNDDPCVGTYKTKERALEVLDEIQHLFIEKEPFKTEFTKDGLTMMNKQPSSVVYEMPEE